MQYQVEMNDRSKFSVAHRLALSLGRPLGLRWVGDYSLGVVYHMGMYHSLRGPGFFWINPFTQTVRDVVKFKPDFISTPFTNLRTRDALQLGLRVALAYRFDPRSVSPQQAALFVEWPQQIHRLIVSDFAKSVLQSIVPRFYAEQICRGEAFETIGESLKTELTNRLKALAMEPVIVMVLEVMVPPALQDSFDAVVKRAVYTQDLTVYEPFDLSYAQRRELYETMRELPGGIRYLNLASAGGDQTVQLPDRRSSRQIVEGTGGPVWPDEDQLDEDQPRPPKPPRSRL